MPSPSTSNSSIRLFNCHQQSGELASTSDAPVTLHSLIQNKVPSLSGCPSSNTPATFIPHPMLPSGIAQTIWGTVGKAPSSRNIEFLRKYIMLPDGGNIALDFTPLDFFSTSQSTTPVIVVLHGALGGSHASYVRTALEPLTRCRSQGGSGFRAVVMNFRGCAGSRLTSPHLYHPRMTDDLASVILYLRSTIPATQLFGLGFSMGAGLLTHYLHETGESSGLSGGFAVSNVFDYVACTAELDSGSFISRHVLNTAIGVGHRQIITKNQAVFRHPSSHAMSGHPSPYDRERIQSALKVVIDRPLTTMSSFTSSLLPAISDFKSDIDFLRETSSLTALSGIRVPTVFLNAEDDPLAGKNLPYEEMERNPWTILAVTEQGGHLGWFTSPQKPALPRCQGRSRHTWPRLLDQWSVKPIVEFFNALSELDLPDRSLPRILPENAQGFTTQANRPSVGFREVSAEYIWSIAFAPSGDCHSGTQRQGRLRTLRNPLVSTSTIPKYIASKKSQHPQILVQLFVLLNIFMQTIGLTVRSAASKVSTSIPSAEHPIRS